MDMKVSMNGLRRNLISAYNSVVTNLKESLLDNCTDSDIERIHRDVDDAFDDLRCQVVFLCCVYEDGNEAFSDLSEDADDLCDFVESSDEE